MTDQCHDLWVTNFCARPAIQYWSDLMNWDKFLTEFKPASIAELGTAYGGMSLYLAAQCYERGLPFCTFDWREPEIVTKSPLWSLLKVRFYHMDFIADKEQAGRLILDLPKPRCLFVDGGNKPLEFTTFVPGLDAGDLVVVHDWGTEFNDPDIEPVRSLVETIFVDASEAVGTFSRWFRRV